MATSQIPKSDSVGEEEISCHECEELLLSLPMEKGWRTGPYCQYQGFWCPSSRLHPVKTFQQQYQARDTDLILATVPRSGTLWLKALAFAIVNRTRYTSSSQHPLLTTVPHQLVPFLEFRVYGVSPVPDINNLQSPRLFATHVPYASLPVSIKDFDCKIVYLCRNPRDNFISLWHFMNKQVPKSPLSLEEAFELFSSGASMFGPFWDHVLGYWKASLERPGKVLFLKYEEMKKDSSSQLKRVAEFLGYPFSMEEEREGVIEEILGLCSFEHLRNLDVNKYGKSFFKSIENNINFRRAEVGDWVNYMTPPMVERLDRLIEEKWHGSGLIFQYSLD